MTEGLPAPIVLGTAQFSTGYSKARPELTVDPNSLLQAASAAGVLAVDTAPAYGQAEEQIGLAWVGTVHTKFEKGIDPHVSVRSSLKNLRRTQLDLVYLHDPREVLNLRNDGVLAQAERLLGASIGLIGASIYEEDEFEAALSDPRVSAIQVPLNLLDRRFESRIGDARSAGKLVFVRSVLLQGTLVRDPQTLGRTGLSDLLPYVERLNAQTRILDLTPLQSALGWARSLPVDGVLLGCDTPEELLQAVDIGCLSEAQLDLFADLPLPPWELVDPRKWTRR
jgi:aryl-alcohol dehydrogenase-like predicted oxidoreductase